MLLSLLRVCLMIRLLRTNKTTLVNSYAIQGGLVFKLVLLLTAGYSANSSLVSFQQREQWILALASTHDGDVPLF
jgi:hypothetical protein